MATLQKTTITEALAEIKLITKKMEQKASFIRQNLVRAAHVPDPLGDSKGKLESEAQSYIDLGTRIINIRHAISKANLECEITVGDTTQTIADWLIWKREIAQNKFKLFDHIQSALKTSIDQASKSPQAYLDAEGKHKFVELVTNLSYPEYAEKSQKVQDQLAKLDGLLSLKNATITIEV